MYESRSGIGTRYIRSLGQIDMKPIVPNYLDSSIEFYPEKEDKLQRIHRLHYIGLIFMIAFLILILLIVYFIRSFFITIPFFTLNTTTDRSSKSIIIKSHHAPYNDCTIRYYYIDIGCFNGETIEHFLHFRPDRDLYEIITFEPDPDNYRVCERRLQSIQQHYNQSFILIQEAAWIRDEEILFRGERGRESRIDQTGTYDVDNLMKVKAIDFSSWLAETVRHQDMVHVKVSMPGAELDLLEKMLLDDTINLADKWDIEWTDRKNITLTPRRIYLQLMFDSQGYNCLYYTRLHDVDNVFRANGTYKQVPKHPDWYSITNFDTYAHYVQRPDIDGPFIRKRIA